MIRKKDLLDAIDCLTVQIAKQGERIHSLEDEVFGSWQKARKITEKKRENTKKAIKEVSKQPRSKDGKFAKKNK